MYFPSTFETTFTAQPLPWRGFCAATSNGSVLSGHVFSLHRSSGPLIKHSRASKTIPKSWLESLDVEVLSSGELQEAGDEREQPGERHLHLAAQWRKVCCWWRLCQVSQLHQQISSTHDNQRQNKTRFMQFCEVNVSIFFLLLAFEMTMSVCPGMESWMTKRRVPWRGWPVWQSTSGLAIH